MTKSSVAPVPGRTDQFYITLTWMPVDDQYGPQVKTIFSVGFNAFSSQVFCAAPVDGRGLTGSQYCINFVVGLGAPNLIKTTLAQGENK